MMPMVASRGPTKSKRPRFDLHRSVRLAKGQANGLHAFALLVLIENVSIVKGDIE